MTGLAMRLRMPRSRFAAIGVASFLWCAFPAAAFAATPISSDITTDTHWTLAGSPYVVSMGNLTYWPKQLVVAAGVTLTVDPGVVIKFATLNGMEVYGTLLVHGTESDPVIFTSLADDAAAGDTNADGNASTPTDGQWMHVEFKQGSKGTFSYTDIRYGGAHLMPVPTTGILNIGGALTLSHMSFVHDAYDGFGQYEGTTTLTDSVISDQGSGVTLSGGLLTIERSHVFNNDHEGVYVYGGTLTVLDSEFDNNETGIFADGSGIISVRNSSIHHNSGVGVDNQSSVGIDARNNWWGDASGPRDSVANQTGAGDSVFGTVAYAPWLTSDPFAVDPCATPGACADNVLFLPGIEGSRLYEGAACSGTSEEKLWEPYSGFWGVVFGAGDRNVLQLGLNTAGESVCPDIYTKEGDIIDSAGGAIYQPVIDQMNALKSAGTISDWAPAAYDWRLSLNDLLSLGDDAGGKINYAIATSTPYIEQTLRRLAASSKTGKVTIIAHSNGGLVAKALLARLGNRAATLVDRVIMVAVPQTGAPADVGSLLLGYNSGIYEHGVTIVSNAAARALAQNSPMAYHLLPSQDYFSSIISEPTHPVAHFSGAAYATEQSIYGNSIIDKGTLDDFLLAKSVPRKVPAYSDLKDPAVANPTLVPYGNTVHDALDNWAPPAGIEVDQIAGWGIDTVAGIDFNTTYGMTAAAGPDFVFKPQRSYNPIFTEDGDGTVPVPSALAMASSTNVKRYWVDLFHYDADFSREADHAHIFTVSPLLSLIESLLKSQSDTLPAYVSTTSPPATTATKKLIFTLHSPLTLQLSDSSGAVTGLSTTTGVSEDVPGSTYGQLGEVQYLVAPAGKSYKLRLAGFASGTFTLDIAESIGGAVTASSSIANVPVSTTTEAHLTITNGISDSSVLSVDENGDGVTDFNVQPRVGTTTQFTSAVTAKTYLAYMESEISALALPRELKRELLSRLKEMDRLASQEVVHGHEHEKSRGKHRKIEKENERSGVSGALVNQIAKLARLVSKTEDHSDEHRERRRENAISPSEVVQILGMLNELKLLVMQTYEN